MNVLSISNDKRPSSSIAHIKNELLFEVHVVGRLLKLEQFLLISLPFVCAKPLFSLTLFLLQRWFLGPVFVEDEVDTFVHGPWYSYKCIYVFDWK